jgi:hypothetical protein
MDLAAENKIRQRVLSMCAGVRRARARAAAADAPRLRTPPRSFNRRAEEFGSAREYNDYLEQVEDNSARAARRGSCAFAARRRLPPSAHSAAARQFSTYATASTSPPRRPRSRRTRRPTRTASRRTA